ncbi:unnamed protein product [Brassica oleracea]
MKRYKCLTRNSSLASAIFVPYYAGLDFRRNIRRRNVAERDAAGNELFKWLKKQPQWKGTHACFYYYLFLNCNYCFRWSPISSPPLQSTKLRLILLPLIRCAIFSFAGAQRPSRSRNGLVRTQVILQCKSSFKNCRFLDCDVKANSCDDPISLMKLFESSVFCLQPPGDSLTRRSIFDSILAGCIPVFFNLGSAYKQYIWHIPSNYSEYFTPKKKKKL